MDSTSLTATEPSRALVPVLLFAALALAPLLGAFGAERYVLALLTRCAIFAIAALGLDLALGCGGLVSFGHAAFIGIGGYAA
ncbi:MAG: branched-chain amino acid ABC transporter permease, partial [Hyphomicrobiales bacterium]|nr:branched-chain amino acid ABC transporter permease [Hyphomicrobiales bacterium]